MSRAAQGAAAGGKRGRFAVNEDATTTAQLVGLSRLARLLVMRPAADRADR